MGFNGFKCKLEYVGPDMAIATDIRFRKVESVDLGKELDIVTRSRDTGKIVKRAAVNSLSGERASFGYRYIDEDGNEVAKDRLEYFARKDGKELKIKPYDRTETIDIKAEIPEDREHEFLIESIYELWADEKNQNALWKLAKHLHEAKTTAISKYSFGNGFKQYFLLLKPIVQGDKFLFQMLLTEKKKEYKNFMDIPSKEKREEAVPTLEEMMENLIA